MATDPSWQRAGSQEWRQQSDLRQRQQPSPCPLTTVIVYLIIASTLLIGSQLATATTSEPSVTETNTQSTETPINITNLRVFDVNGIQRLFYMQSQQLELATTLESRNGYGGNVVVISEVRDERGVAVMLETQPTVLLGDAPTVRIPWTPDVKGKYQVRALVLESLDNPIVLSPLSMKTVEVDRIRVQQYYLNNEAAISIGVADEKVRQIFDGQEMILFHVRAFGVGFPGCEGACGIMFLHNGNNSQNMDLGIDLTKKQVISIKVTPQLVSEDQIEVFRFVEDDPARATIAFEEPIPLDDFTAAVLKHDIAVLYAEYMSDKTRAGHGSVTEPFDVETLKAILESQGEELVGIASFTGLAEAEDWLKFLREDASSSSLTSLEIRGSNFLGCLAGKEEGEVVC